MSTIDVELRTGQNVIDVDLSKNGNDKVCWISKDEKAYLVNFPGGGPFDKSSFEVPAGKFATSSTVRTDVIPPEDPGQTLDFKYSIHHTDSGWLLDPKIGVKK